ncbi:MAG TPA: YihY/virulence factor BrkB family protein [Cytophagales bacterium]|nr:YihY/virulence factor BrkB family protein [Cytophagales bacterium]
MKLSTRKIQTRFEKSSLYDKTKTALMNVKVSSHKVPLWEVLRVFSNQITKDDINNKANAMAFSFMLAVFPGIIFLFTLIPYIPVNELDIKILKFLADVMPTKVYLEAKSTITDIISKPRGGLLSFGFILALLSAMNGSVAMMSAFNKCYKTVERRNFITVRLTALYITFVLVFILIFAIVAITIGEVVLHFYFDHLSFMGSFELYFFLILRYIVVFVTFFLCLSFIYYVAPSLHKKFDYLSIGALIGTVLIILVSLGFSLYLNKFATFNKVYGSIGTLIALMLWFYLISLTILIGFELNASVDTVRILTERNHKIIKKNAYRTKKKAADQ